MMNDRVIYSKHRLKNPLLRILFFAPCFFYILLVFLRFLISNPIAYTFITVFTIGYGFILLITFFYLVGYEGKTLIFIFIPIVSSFLSLAVINNDTYLASIFMLCNLGYGSSILITRERSSFFSKTFWFYLLIFFVFIKSGGDPEDFFRISRNFISVFILLLLSIYLILLWKEGKSPSLLLMFCALIVCFWAEGRAGILVVSGVFFCTILIYKKFKHRFIIVFSLGLIYFYFVGLNENLISFYKLSFNRFENHGLADVRILINKEYINAVFGRIDYLLFGVLVDEIDLIVNLGGNPHNSYINLHMNYGFLGFLFMFFPLLYALSFLVWEKKYPIALAVMAVLLRSFFDITIFYGPLDPILYFSVIYIFVSRCSVFVKTTVAQSHAALADVRCLPASAGGFSQTR